MNDSLHISKTEIFKDTFPDEIPGYNTEWWNEVEDTTEARIATFIDRYSLIVFFVFGLIGNSLTFLVMLRSRPWKVWTLYLAVLAVSDTLCLLIKLICYEIYDVYIEIELPPLYCPVVLFFGMTITEFSHWIIATMTVDRLLVIWFPFSINGSNVRRVVKTVLALAVLLPAHNSVYFLFEGDMWNPMTFGGCKPNEGYNMFVNDYWRWIRASIYGIIPGTVVILANIFIVVGWVLGARRHRQLTQTDNSLSNEDVSKHIQITVVILIISGCFALVIVPHVAVLEYINIFPQQSQQSAKEFLIKTVLIALADINYCCNFLLYTATSRIFRKKLTDMCELCK